MFSIHAVLPLILVLGYVIVKGGNKISLVLFTDYHLWPDGGGIANAIVGTLVVTVIAALIAIPVGVGGGIFLAEYSRSGLFAQFIRFGTNVLSGVPSIIAGGFIYGTIVTSRVLFGNAYSAVAGGMALSILMLPTVIKTTDEGLKLVSDDLRRGAWEWVLPDLSPSCASRCQRHSRPLLRALFWRLPVPLVKRHH